MGWRRMLAISLTLSLAAFFAAAASANAVLPDYAKGYDLGLEAFKYGLPIVKTDQTFRIETSVDVNVGNGRGPLNHFNNVGRLADAGKKDVVLPNNDTPYSIAWLDLSHQPMVIHVPKVSNRYFVFEMLDPYTENFSNPGSKKKTKPGDYVITGPGQNRVRIPKGTHRIKTRYDRVWIIGRTLSFGPSDMPNVRKIQKRYRVTPLSRYVGGLGPKAPRGDDRTVDEVPTPTGLAFFDKLGYLLKRFPPPKADAPELSRLATIGVGPGRKPSGDGSLSAETRQGMIDAVAAGPGALQNAVTQRYVSEFAAHNGWLVTPHLGHYGTDYGLRAAVAQFALGAIQPRQAIYPLAQADRTLTPLTGAKTYVVHFAPGQLPPVQAFWSMTLYDTAGFLVANPIDRYSVGDRTDLGFNPDGSLDIYVQSVRPTDPAQARNWLPSQAGANFRLMMRLYQTRPERIAGVLDGSGWDPPTITAVP